MTIIQSQKDNTIFRLTLTLIVGAIVVSGGMLVFLYNRSVNLQHAMSDMTSEIKKLQTQSAELQDNTFAIFSTARVEAFAAEHGLVKDKNPQYLNVDPQWFLASRY